MRFCPSDLLFQQIYVFFIVELETRRMVHYGVTRHPSQFWVAQQLREATPNGEKPRFILRDNDNKYGSAFDIVAEATGIEVLPTQRVPSCGLTVRSYQRASSCVYTVVDGNR